MDFALCSLCGLCIDVCPTVTLKYSRIYDEAGYNRDWTFDLLEDFQEGEAAYIVRAREEEAKKKQMQEEAKDDPSVPLLIPCEACRKEVSKKTEKCMNCGHPAADSVVAYKKAQELARIRRGEEAAAAKKRFEERERQYGVIIAEAIDFKKFQRRVKEGELIWYYEQTPYSGWEKKIQKNR